MQLTIPQVAKLYGKHRSTIHRHIESGRLSCGFRGDGTRVVEMAELVRCYGEPKHLPPELQPPATPDQDSLQQAMLQALQDMHRELVALREDVATLRRLPPPPDPDQGNQEESPPRPQEPDNDPHGFRAMAREVFQGEDKDQRS